MCRSLTLEPENKYWVVSKTISIEITLLTALIVYTSPSEKSIMKETDHTIGSEQDLIHIPKALIIETYESGEDLKYPEREYC